MKPGKCGRLPYSSTSVSCYWSNFYQACTAVPGYCNAPSILDIIFETLEAVYESMKGKLLKVSKLFVLFIYLFLVYF
jgi:hypothetical protein